MWLYKLCYIGLSYDYFIAILGDIYYPRSIRHNVFFSFLVFVRQHSLLVIIQSFFVVNYSYAR